MQPTSAARSSASLYAICVVVLGTACMVDAVQVRARDCAVADEAQACASNDQCRCGTNAATQRCDVGAAECVSGTACVDFCTPYGYGLGPVCRAGRCIRARQTGCVGDCDADASVDIAELVTGIDVTLGVQPLAACSSLDADGDGATHIGELITAVRSALDGCAATLPRRPGHRGIYDGTVTLPGEFGGRAEAVGDVYETDAGLSLQITITPNRGVSAGGSLQDGTLTLAGFYFVTDYGTSITGTATVDDQDEQEVIEGTLHDEFDSGIGVPSAFSLRRSSIKTPERFAGTYRFELPASPSGNGLPSTFTVALQVAGDGAALSTDAEDRGRDGRLFGTVTSGDCAVAPEGHLRCSTLYLLADSDQYTPLHWNGVLVPDGDTIRGQGPYLAGVDPPFGPQPYVPGSWTAIRSATASH